MTDTTGPSRLRARANIIGFTNRDVKELLRFASEWEADQRRIEALGRDLTWVLDRSPQLAGDLRLRKAGFLGGDAAQEDSDD